MRDPRRGAGPPGGRPAPPAGRGGPPGTPASRPPRRPISARSPLEGRQLWRIGDWGSASEHIGRRWETVGVACIERLVGVERPGPTGEPYTPSGVLVLSAEPALAAAVQANGKSHADALLVGEHAGRAVLEPVDFKWTLETANPKQVGAEVLGELLTAPPALLAARLSELMAGLPVSDPVYLDGVFLAPEHRANREHLAPHGPLDPSWAVLCPVDGTDFFSPLPGWDVAEALARFDGAYLGTVESAEKYYRLGAGVLGALRRLEAGIFAEAPADLDGPAALAGLRRERRLTTSGEVIAYLDRALGARSELVDKLREVERAGYPFARFREDLAQRGVGAGGSSDRRSGRLYGSVMKAVGAQIRVEGRALVAAGSTELDALEELDTRRARWLALAREQLPQRVAARPDSPEGDEPPREAAATEPGDVS